MLIFWQFVADRIARVLKTSGPTQVVVLWRLYINSFLQSQCTSLLHKFKLYRDMKSYFILLNHFVVVKKLWILFWRTGHLLSVSLMLEYLRILFPIVFALNEQKKVKLGRVRIWKLHLHVTKYWSNLLMF